MNQHLYILGHPIAHSKSPVMYNAVFDRLGLPWSYEKADMPTQQEARAFLEGRNFLSVNVTTPCKGLAYELATHRAASAKLANGANVLVRHEDALIAYNTDGQGCVAFLERAGFDFVGKTVVVCGTGPTALAICHACSIAGVAEIVLVGRDRQRALDIMAVYVGAFEKLALATVDLPPVVEHHRTFCEALAQTTFKFGSYSTSKQTIAAADLVINATPLGMREGDEAPFDTTLLSSKQWVFDAIYAHGETALVAAARAAGCTTFDGAGMLVAQAVASVGIVTDIAQAPVALDSVDLFALMAEAAQFDIL